MESKKPRGRSRAVLIVGAAVLCVGLVGASYLLRDERPTTRPGQSSPPASTIQPLFRRCDEPPGVETVDGLTRKICTARSHPQFMIYADLSGDVIERVGLMVPINARDGLLQERKLVGLELFGLVAGVPAETFLPPEQIAQIGSEETRFTREGLVYTTQPIANIGLIFLVVPDTQASPN